MGSKTRLNMDHGFMKVIIRNQVDRDNYDKEVKALKSMPKKSAGKNRKPELKPYTPPQKSSGEKSDERQKLMRFQYEDESGKVHTFDVYKGDDPYHLARRVDNACGGNFTPAMSKALVNFLKDQINKTQMEHG